MPSPRLLALDLDGTLLRRDGTIDARDLAAIRRAREGGVHVTIATGRLATGAIATARALELDAPMVCADGGTMVCTRTGALLEQWGLDLPRTEAVLRILGEHTLAPFVFMHDVIHCDELARAHAPYVSTWTTEVTIHPSLAEATGWRRPDDATGVAMTLGIGERARVEAAHAAIERAHGGALHTVAFGLSSRPEWVLRSMASGRSKGVGVERLAERLGVARANVAVVGDWMNDLSMFAWAGRSFAMGQAPEIVRAAATDRLEATATTGGGVAEAIERWLSSPPSGAS